MKKFLSLTLALLLLLTCVPFAAFADEDGETVDAVNETDATSAEIEETATAGEIEETPKTPLETLPEEQEKVAQVGNFTLYVDMKTGAFSVYDSKADYLWTHGVDAAQYQLKVSGTWNKRMNSIIEVQHFDKSTKENIKKYAFAPGDNSSAKITKIKNGVSEKFDFASIGISVTVEITLDENGFEIYIPADKLEETKKRGIVAIAVLPAFGAGGMGEEGYIAYPDGAGGLTDFTKRDERPKSISEETWNIYGPDSISIDTYRNLINTKANVASIPMFGIVKGNNACLSMIETGDTDALLRMQVAGYPATIDLYRCFFEFTYRHVYAQYMSNITINGKDRAQNPTVEKIDLEMSAVDRRVKYVLLTGDDADYSGIAAAYREVLLENGTLTKKVTAQSDIPLEIDFFIGIMEDMGIYEAQTIVTTFENCKTILEALKKSGVGSINTILKGWEKNGYGALPNVSINSGAGGRSGLVSLADFARDNGISVALFTNFMFGYEKNGGFSLKNDVLYNGANIPIASKTYKNIYILTPAFSAENHAKLLKNVAACEGVGVAYANITKYLYFDYHDTQPISRDETAELWKSIMKTTSEQNRAVAVQYGNLYSLQYADWVFSVPIQSSRKYTCDADIPLLQLVLHGVLPYSAEPLNLSSDLVETKLKWIEFGCMPVFELTYESSVKLKNTSYNKLFSSQYERWLEKAVEIYNEFNGELKFTWNSEIVDHEIIKDGLVAVTYSNGNLIYINYNDSAAEVDGVAVPACDYVVVKGR